MELGFMIFHNYAGGCPGVIVPKQEPDGRIALECAECGNVVGMLDDGALEQINELVHRKPGEYEPRSGKSIH